MFLLARRPAGVRSLLRSPRIDAQGTRGLAATGPGGRLVGSWVPPAEFTVLVRATVDAQGASNQVLIQFDNGTEANRLNMRVNAGNTQLHGVTAAGPGGTTTPGNITFGVPFVCGFTYRSSRFVVFVAGGVIQTRTLTIPNTGALGLVRLGHTADSLQLLGGLVDRLSILPIMSDAELQSAVNAGFA